jgi:hypothetical protein
MTHSGTPGVSTVVRRPLTMRASHRLHFVSSVTPWPTAQGRPAFVGPVTHPTAARPATDDSFDRGEPGWTWMQGAIAVAGTTAHPAAMPHTIDALTRGQEKDDRDPHRPLARRRGPLKSLALQCLNLYYHILNFEPFWDVPMHLISQSKSTPRTRLVNAEQRVNGVR